MRAWRVLAALSLAGWASGGSAASAQLASGYSGSSDAPVAGTEGEYWFFIRELGRCLVQSKRARSVAFLRTAIGSPEESRAFGALINRRGNNVCMRNVVSAGMVRAHVRGIVAENLFTSLPVAAAEAIPQGFAGQGEVRSLPEFADCYVAGNYAAARSLLAETRLASQEETNRIRMMAPGFGSCLPQGQEIRIVPIEIRLALAEALYRARVSRAAPLEGSN